MLRLAVIGGGIGGLTAAVALRATGAHVQVFEQARQLSEVGAGLGIQHNGQRVLVRLGLGPEINRIGSRLKGFRICGPMAAWCRGKPTRPGLCSSASTGPISSQSWLPRCPQRPCTRVIAV